MCWGGRLDAVCNTKGNSKSRRVCIYVRDGLLQKKVEICSERRDGLLQTGGRSITTQRTVCYKLEDSQLQNGRTVQYKLERTRLQATFCTVTITTTQPWHTSPALSANSAMRPATSPITYAKHTAESMSARQQQLLLGWWHARAARW